MERSLALRLRFFIPNTPDPPPLVSRIVKGRFNAFPLLIAVEWIWFFFLQVPGGGSFFFFSPPSIAATPPGQKLSSPKYFTARVMKNPLPFFFTRALKIGSFFSFFSPSLERTESFFQTLHAFFFFDAHRSRDPIFCLCVGVEGLSSTCLTPILFPRNVLHASSFTPLLLFPPRIPPPGPGVSFFWRVSTIP